jgi:hypothetical protein
MVKPFYPTAVGPFTDDSLEMTALSPSDTNTTDKAITRTMPLIREALADADGNLYVVRPAVNDIPDCYAMMDQTDPDCPVGIRSLGSPVAGGPSTGLFTDRLAYSNSIPAVSLPDYLQVCADGVGAWLLVKHSDATGIGRVLKAANGTAIVEF